MSDTWDDFIFYPSWIDTISGLSDGTRLEILEAIIRYGCFKEVPEALSEAALLVFNMAVPNIDASQQRRKGGAKGGRPSKKPQVKPQAKTNGFNHRGKPKVASLPSLKEEGRREKGEEEKEEEKKGTTVPKEKAAPSQSLVEFESFWSGCQKKVGKPAALKAWQKMRKENRTTLTGEQLLERYNSIVEMETKERGTAQYVPHPATWINQDRWDDDVIEPIKKYPFNQRVYYVTTEDTHPLNHDILAWVLDRKWYCDDKTGKVFNDKGELQTNITIDPEGDLEKW